MSTTLKEILSAVESFRSSISQRSRESIANKYLGKFKKIIPKGKTSTQFIRELRSSLYGKIK